MAPLISHDLNSPVSLLWAHQLRREHATIVAQLEETKELHPSASELKKLVTRTEKAEAASNKLRKEVAELKTAHQKTVKVVESWRRDLQVKEKAHTVSFADREEKEERFRLEIETLSELLKRQEGGLASVADEVRNIQNQAEEGNEATEQRLLQKEDEIIELRGLIRALDAKIGDAVTVIKDSVECAKTTEALTAPPENVSDADSFDLDANMETVTAAPSGADLGPSLAMIKEPTLPRYSQRLQDQHCQASMMGESMEMLPDPPFPALPEQTKPKAVPAQVTGDDIDLVQGKSTLSIYIQIADSQYQETPPAEEERFVNAFIHGLRDKRDRKKCEKKVREAGKTWGNLKECFPVASQQSQSHGKTTTDVRKRKIVDAMQTTGMRDGIPTLATAKERMDLGRREPALLPPKTSQGEQNNQVRQGHRAAERARTPSPPAAAQKGSLVDEGDRGAEQARLPDPAAAAATKKRPLDKQDNGQVENALDRAPPAAKKRRTKKGGRGQGRPPSIPILPSSDDEFSRGCRK